MTEFKKFIVFEDSDSKEKTLQLTLVTGEVIEGEGMEYEETVFDLLRKFEVHILKDYDNLICDECGSQEIINPE